MAYPSSRYGLAIAALIGATGLGGTSLAADVPGMAMPAAVEKPASATTSRGLAEVQIGPDIQQRIGVALGAVEHTPLTMTIRSVGIVRANETRIAHIHLKTDGWVEKLFVGYTGQTVKAGEPMLSIYSPAFFAAQREFLAALRSAGAAGTGAAADQQIMVEVARRRLELWDVPKDAIDALEKTGRPSKSLILRSPISGTVLEKKAFEGQYVMSQGELYVVADLSTVWVQGKLFEYELEHVKIGMPATVTLAALGSRPLTGKIVFADPTVDETSRSVRVRIELSNPDGVLKPGMFGRITVSHDMGSGLTVPMSAVLRSGERDVAFVAVDSDRFVPVPVKISPLRFGDRYQVLEGLSAGDRVVTSANFLIDSESRLRAGGDAMAGMGHGSGGAKPAGQAPNPSTEHKH